MVYPGLSVSIIRSITVKSIIPDNAIVLKETDTLLGMIASYWIENFLSKEFIPINGIFSLWE